MRSWTQAEEDRERAPVLFHCSSRLGFPHIQRAEYVALSQAMASKSAAELKRAVTDDRDVFRRLMNLVEALTGGVEAEDRRLAIVEVVVLLVAALVVLVVGVLVIALYLRA